MVLRSFSRVFKYGLYGSVTIGGIVAVGKIQESEYDLDSLAIVRIMRTAYTAVDIGRTYQTMLYSKDWDRTSDEYIEVRSQAHKIGAEKLLKLCRINKGVYIKVGQHIGALDYLIPSEYVATMRVLHKDAPMNSVDVLYKVIQEDLKKDPNELFDDFEPLPLGTASLAQVHKAKLKDGTVVAVKVQHHFVRNTIHIDLQWMEFVIYTMSKVFPDFQMNWLVEETKKNIAKELNFLQEGRNSEKLANMFSHYKWLKVPKIFWDFSSERVLVMEYVNGGQVNDVQYIDKNKIDKLDLCSKLGDLYAHMIFVTGFVHSDPHPGNILLKQNPGDKEVTVYLLDHGLYAQLSDKFRYQYSKLWLSIIDRDPETMKFYSAKLGIEKELYALFVCMVTGRPWDAIIKGVSYSKSNAEEKSLFQRELPNFLPHLFKCLEHVDRDALLVLKTNDLIRCIESTLGVQERMCGFVVMSKCCARTVFHQEYKNHKYWIQKQLLTIKFGWTMLVLYAYSLYLKLVYSIYI